jgi:hypothetical protein
MDAYLAADIEHEKREAKEWYRSLAVEQRAAEILGDPDAIDIAVGDQVYGSTPFEPERFIKARGAIANANTSSDLMTAAIAYRVELELIAKKQAESEINKGK